MCNQFCGIPNGAIDFDAIVNRDSGPTMAIYTATLANGNKIQTIARDIFNALLDIKDGGTGIVDIVSLVQDGERMPVENCYC